MRTSTARPVYEEVINSIVGLAKCAPMVDRIIINCTRSAIYERNLILWGEPLCGERFINHRHYITSGSMIPGYINPILIVLSSLLCSELRLIVPKHLSIVYSIAHPDN